MTRISTSSKTTLAPVPPPEASTALAPVPKAADVYDLAGRALARVAMPATAAGLMVLALAAFAPNDAAALALYGGATTAMGVAGLGGAWLLLKR